MTGGLVESAVVAVLSAILGGGITGAAAAAAVRIEIKWLTITSDRHERAVTRAHDRIDAYEGRISSVESRVPPVVVKTG